MRIAFLGNNADRIAMVYGDERRRALEAAHSVVPGVIGPDDFVTRAVELAGVEAIFSTWGMPRLDAGDLARLPALRAVFYAAGSVKRFAPPLLERGITVCSAWAANAVPVAEFTLAQILLSLKGYWRNCREYQGLQAGKAAAFRGRGAYGASVALLGYGQVARAVRALLRHHRLEVLVVDPYLSASEAADEDVTVVELAEAFARAQVVSNHLPNIPATEGLIDGAVLGRLPPDATFINTGRGASVVEADLIACCRERPDVTALLDVTWPEPPLPDSPLYDLPNVQLSGHIAGSINDECGRMADWMIAEFERWRRGEALRFAIDAERLATMA